MSHQPSAFPYFVSLHTEPYCEQNNNIDTIHTNPSILPSHSHLKVSSCIGHKRRREDSCSSESTSSFVAAPVEETNWFHHQSSMTETQQEIQIHTTTNRERFKFPRLHTNPISFDTLLSDAPVVTASTDSSPPSPSTSSMHTLSPSREISDQQRAVDAISPVSTMALSNPSSPPMSPQRDQSDKFSSTSSATSAGAISNCDSSLPSSTNVSSAASLSCSPLYSSAASSPASSTLNGAGPSGMRNRFMKMTSLSTLSVPTETAESKLAQLIIPILNHPPEPKRSPASTMRSLTPPPMSSSPCAHGVSTSSSLLNPFNFARSFDAAMDGVQSSGAGFGVAAQQGPRPSMQDSFTCLPKEKFFAVCDGHGRSGHIVASLTTSMLPTLFRNGLTNHSHNPKPAFEEAFKLMDEHLLKHTSQGGCTALAAHLNHANHGRASSLFLAHVGDSRAVLCHKGHARALTQDHKPELPEERAAIQARGGTVSQSKRNFRLDGPQPPVRAPSTPQLGNLTSAAQLNPFSTAFSSLHSNSSSAMHSPATTMSHHPSAFKPSPHASPRTILTPTATTVANTQASSWRVEGLLNLSRSLGDGHLKQYISAVPTVLEHQLHAADEFVILATDGVWSVLSESEAVNCVREYMTQHQQQSQQSSSSTTAAAAATSEKHIHSLPARAANQLVNLALQKGSMDNVMACVVLLQQ